MKLHTQKEAWPKWGSPEVWEIFTEPGRPSRGDIRQYNSFVKKAIKNKKNLEIMILGATPEIRDMLYKYSVEQNAKITCTDMSTEMYEAMTKLTHFNTKPNESFLNASWVDMDHGKQFDVILGDYVNVNIDHNLKYDYYKNILRHLKKDGAFIVRDCVVPDNYLPQGIEKIIDKYETKVKNEEITLKLTSSSIGDELLFDSWHKDKDNIVAMEKVVLDIKSYEDKIKSHDRKIALKKDIYNYFLDTWYKLAQKKYWTYYLASQNLEHLKKYFVIIDRQHAKDYDPILSEGSPIFYLKKK